MIKLLIILLLLCQTPAFSMSSSFIESEVWCVDGYKFIYSWVSSTDTILVVTPMFDRGRVAIQAFECDGTEKKVIRSGE